MLPHRLLWRLNQATDSPHTPQPPAWLTDLIDQQHAQAEHVQPQRTCQPQHPTTHMLILDDHPPIREWLADLLAPLGIGTISARSGEEALGFVRDGAPVAAAICDVLMPHAEIEGVEAARMLWHDHGIPCLMLTSVQEAGARVAALYAGAIGYVVKDLAHGDLVREGIRALLAGDDLPDPLATIAVSDAELRQIDERHAACVRAIEQLTPQQRVVAQLLQEGKTNREIAEQLVLSRGTVNTHVSHILERLNLVTRRAVKSRVLFSHDGHIGGNPR
jgi:RNA polymerase sigma factor (sigma-70 family)